MKKNRLIIISIIVIVILVITIKTKNKFNDISDNIVVIQYEVGTDIQLKKINIISDEDKKELSKYVRKLKPLKNNHMVNLALAREIEIEYTDSIYVGIQLEEKQYCYYIDKEKNISSLSKMPKGLYEWIEEKIK